MSTGAKADMTQQNTGLRVTCFRYKTTIGQCRANQKAKCNTAGDVKAMLGPVLVFQTEVTPGPRLHISFSGESTYTMLSNSKFWSNHYLRNQPTNLK